MLLSCLWFFASSQEKLFGQTADRLQGMTIIKLTLGECFTSTKPELVIEKDQSQAAHSTGHCHAQGPDPD